MSLYGNKKLYLYEPDPDWIPLYWLDRNHGDDPDLTEYELTYDEYVEYMSVVHYVETFHERLKRWKNE